MFFFNFFSFYNFNLFNKEVGLFVLNTNLPSKTWMFAALNFSNFFYPKLFLFKKKNFKFLKKNPDSFILTKFLNFFISKGLKIKLSLFFVDFLKLNFLKIMNKTYFTFYHLFYIYFFFFNWTKKNKKPSYLNPQIEGFDYLNKSDLILKFLNLVKEVDPIFIFKFNRVDKKIRKYSRGRIGKYKCSFKYLPAYKRLNFVFLTLKKDFMFLRKNTFDKKLHNLLFNFLFKNYSLIYNIKRYSNFFFYNNVSIFRI